MKIALAVACLVCSQAAWGQEQGKSELDDLIRYLIRSAEQGDVVAQYKLGSMYDTGQGAVKVCAN